MNKRKKIVFIRQTAIYYDSRATKTIQALSKDFDVVVLGWNRTDEPIEQIRQKLCFDNVQFEFYDAQLKHGSGIKGLFKLAGFVSWVNKTTKKIGHIDAIHACDLDGAVGIVHFANKKKIPIVYDIYDYYIDSHFVPSICRGLVEKLEINTINRSSCCIVCTEQRKSQIIKASPKYLEIIENTPKISMDEISSTNEKTIEDKKFDVVLVYVGVLMENRLLREILEVISQHPNCLLYIGGVGELEEYVVNSAKMHSNVKYMGKMPYTEVLKLEKKADFLFATYNPNIANHKFSAANKIYEAMALGKPIFVCNDTGMDAIVRDENLGWTIDYDAESMFEIILENFQNEELLKKIQDNALTAYKTKHSWEIMEERLQEIYTRILPKG